MTETAKDASYLTQDAYDRLRAELTQLTDEGRTEIARRIEAAREAVRAKASPPISARRDEER